MGRSRQALEQDSPLCARSGEQGRPSSATAIGQGAFGAALALLHKLARAAVERVRGVN